MRLLLRPASDRAGLPAQAACVVGDLHDGSGLAESLSGVRTVYHVAHVRFTAAVVTALPPSVERLVIVSSLRALSGVPSGSVDEVLAGEAAVADLGVPWTILRPSMIFGPGDDRNISRLASRLQRLRWLPTVGPACRHQPVFVDDVVDAILAAAERPAAIGQTYAIAGPEPLPYAALVAAVGAAVGVRPRQVALPGAVVAAAMAGLERLGYRGSITAEQVRRMQEDKSYDIGPARRDLGFAPLAFEAALRRIHGAAESRA